MNRTVHRASRTVSILAALAMLAGLFPMLSLPAAASSADAAVTQAASGNDGAEAKSEMTDQTYRDLGIQLNKPEGFDPNDGENPYGTDDFVKLKSVYDIGMFRHQGEKDASPIRQAVSLYSGFSQQKRKLTDHINPDYNVSGTSKAGGNSLYAMTSVSLADPSDKDRAGVKDTTVEISIDNRSDFANMHLIAYQKERDPMSFANLSGHPFTYLTDVKDDDKTDLILGEIKPWEQEGFLQIAGGDFDGDGKDEVALYFPVPGNPEIRIYKIIPTPGGKKQYDYQLVRTFELTDYSGTSYYDKDSDAYKATPLVDLTVGDIDRDGVEDLIITANKNYNNWTGGGSSRVYIIDQQVARKLQDVPTEKKVRLSREDLKPDAYIASIGVELYDSHVFLLAGTTPINEGKGEKDYDYALFNVSTDLGDVDADGLKELVFAGLAAPQNKSKIGSASDFLDKGNSFLMNYIRLNPEYLTKTNVPKYERGETTSLVKNRLKNLEVVDTGASKAMTLISVACAQFDLPADGKTSANAVVFVEGTIMQKGPNTNHEGYPTSSKKEFSYRDNNAECIRVETGGTQYECINQVIAGNFNNDPLGREDFAFVYTSHGNGGGIYHTPGTWSEHNLPYSDPNLVTTTGVAGDRLTSQIYLWKPELSKNSARVRYKSKAYSYSDPVPMAIMVSPPYFDDLAGMEDYGFQENSETTWEKTKAESVTNTIGLELTGGVMFGFEKEVDIPIVGAAGIDIETSVGASFSLEAAVGRSLSTSTGFTTHGGTNSVAIWVYPMIDYTFEMWVPDAKLPYDADPIDVNGTIYKAEDTIAGHWEDMVISVPQQCTQTIVDLDTYDEVARRTKGMEPIQDNIIHSQPGDPWSYKQEFDRGLMGERSELYEKLLGKEEWITATASGGNAASRTITCATSEAIDTMAGIYANFSVGGSVAGAKAAVEWGATESVGLTMESSEETSYSATVVNMPKEAAGYSFDWQFGVWHAKMKGRDVPVLDYTVRNISGIPHIARNLHVDDTTATTATLAWDVVGEYPIGGYDVERYSEEFKMWIKVGELMQGNNYTDMGLDPYTEYRYRLISRGKTESLRSMPSEEAVGRTLYDGPLPTITQQPEDVSVKVGGAATFSVKAAPAPEVAGELSYQWQQRVGGAWETLKGYTSRDLRFTNLTYEQDGGIYRCVVSQYIDGGRRLVPSEPAALTVRDNNAEVSLTLPISGDPRMFEVGKTYDLKATVTPAQGSRYSLAGGTVTFSITDLDNDLASTSITVDLGDDNTAAAKWRPAAARHYELSAVYNGNQYYSAAGSDLYEGYAYNKSVRQIIIDAPDTLMYGETAAAGLYELTTGGAKINWKLWSVTSSDESVLQPSGGNLVAKGVGTATVTFCADNGLRLSKEIRVTRMPISITVPDKEIARTQPLPAVGEWQAEFSIDAPDFKPLIMVDAPKGEENMNLGVYPVPIQVNLGTRVNVDTPTQQEYTVRNYDVTKRDGSLTVTPLRHSVTYESSINGKLAAIKVLASGARVPVASGERIDEQTRVILTAEPEAGFQPAEWIVNGTKYEPGEGALSPDGLEFTVDALTEDVAASVNFDVLNWMLEYDVWNDAFGTLEASVNGQKVTQQDPWTYAPVYVVDGSAVEFTAVPDEGFMVWDWLIDDVPQNNHSETFRIDNFNRDMKVEVQFNAEYMSTVTAETVGDGTVEITGPAGEPLGNPAQIKPNSAVTLRAVPGPGSMFVKWTDANGKDLQGSNPEYVIDLSTGDLLVSADMTVIAVFRSRLSCNLYYALRNAKPGDSIRAKLDGNLLQNFEYMEGGQSYVPGGSTVEFEVTPGKGRMVDGWSIGFEPVEGLYSRSFTLEHLSGPTDVYAYVADKVDHTLDYAVTPNLKGEHNGLLAAEYTETDQTPQTIDAAESGSITAVKYSAVTLIAQPDPFCRVKHWTVDGEAATDADGNLITTATYSIDHLTDNATVTVEFESDRNILTYAAQGHGAVTAAVESLPDGVASGATLTPGTQVTFTAVPDEGYELTGWTVDGEPVKTPDGDVFADMQYTLEMNGSADVKAVFEGQYVAVLITSSGDGSAALAIPGTEPDAAEGRARRGTEITVLAQPGQGQRIQWSVNETELAEESSPHLKLTLDETAILDGEVHINAAFTPEQLTLNYGCGDIGRIEAVANGESAQNGDTVDGGTLVIVTVHAPVGKRAVWTISGTDAKPDSGRLKFVMADHTNIQVAFEDAPVHTLTITENAGGSHTVLVNHEQKTPAEGTLSVTEGDRVSITAMPDPYQIVRDWTVTGAEPAETEGNTRTFVMTGDVMVELTFGNAAEYAVAYRMADDGDGSVIQGYVSAPTGQPAEAPFVSGTAQSAGSSLTFRITPGENRMVAYWEINGERLKNESGADYVKESYTCTLKAPMAVTAHMTDAVYYDVTFSQPSGGTLSAAADGAVLDSGSKVAGGRDVIFTFTPDSRYSLSGWFVNGVRRDESGNTLAVSGLSEAIDVRVTAAYKSGGSGGGGGGGGGISSYTVTFDSQGGSEVAKEWVSRNSTVKKPADPTRESYTFGGWYTDKACTQSYDFETKVTSSFTLYAKWTQGADGPGEPQWKNPFTDVTESDWFYDYVRYVNENRLFMGVAETLFAPGDAMTRGMLVTVLYRAEGEPAAGTASFADVPAGAYYAKAVAWAAKNHIVKGYDAAVFAPEDLITREQLAAILQRYADYLGRDTTEKADLSNAPDSATISEWAKGNMEWAVGAGIIMGKDNGMIDPLGSATRAETAAMLQRFMEQASDALRGKRWEGGASGPLQIPAAAISARGVFADPFGKYNAGR